MSTPQQEVLLIGAGHAHLHVLTRAAAFTRAGARLTLVTPEPFWYFSNMAAEVLSGHYALADFRVELRPVCDRYGVRLIHDEIVGLTPERRELIAATGQLLEYDLASFAVGSVPAEREGDVPVDGSFSLLPVRNILEIRNELETFLELEPDRSPQLVVLGAGPSGVEVALNLAALLALRSPVPGWTLTLLERKGRVLSALGAAASRAAADALRRAGVSVRTGIEILHVQSGRVVLERGETLNFDLAIVAMGARSPDLFVRAGLLTDDAGALLVDRTLRCRDHPELFAAGDCARLWGLGLPNTTDQARAQGPVLAHNLLAALRGRPLTPYRPRANRHWISLGPRAALWSQGRWACHGGWVLAWKRRRERQYLRAYQRVRPSTSAPTS